MDLMKIYNSTPIFIQNFLTTLKGYQNKRERNGEHYEQSLDFLATFDYSNPTLIQAYQDQELRRLVKYAAENSPFYAELYQDIDLDGIKGVADLEKLPILEKNTVRQNLQRMYTQDEREAFVSYTSGTTGAAMKYLHTFEGLQLRNAFLDHFKRQHGFINGKMKKATFSAAIAFGAVQKGKIFGRDNRLMKQRLYSAYHLQEENIPYYLADLNEFKPAALDGYPSCLYELARYINKHDFKLEFQPVAIFPTAETLLPHYRREIERAFQAPMFDQYASSEAAPFVTECVAGNLHQNSLSGIIEQDENNEMIVTSFMNDGTPLIRYRIGDQIKFATDKTQCACGSALPLVEGLQGRSSNYIESSARGRFTEVFLSLEAEKFNSSIAALQFIQPEVDHIIIKVVPDEGYTKKMERNILEQISLVFGDDMTVELHEVPTIEKDQSGKFRFIINEVEGRISA